MTSVHDLRYRVVRSVLKELRAGADLTQVEIAAALEVGQSFVSKVERGEANLDLLFFVRWCQVCKREPEKVLAEIIQKL